MKIVILGGGGVIGQKTAHALAASGTLRGQQIERLVLADIAPPAVIDAPFAVGTRTGDIANRADVDAMIDADVDVVFHLAAVVSGQAEADLDIGLAANLHGTLNVLERCRALGTCPIVVYTSSMAAYGGEVPDPITDFSVHNPQTSYGAQKVIGELLLTDYSRRGLIDGRGFRLPTISVRPGAANLAASSFMSSIIREPLNGAEAICPVDPAFEHLYLSPRACVANLIRGAEIETEALGMNRCMLMPGRTWTIAQLIEAMTRIAGPEPARLIRWEPQPEVQAIVMGWRARTEPVKALLLGLRADESFDDNVRYYLEDDRPRA